MSAYAGPMGLANQEIRDASERFAVERLGSQRLPTLLSRTDAMLTELETLNLMDVQRTPAPLLSAVTVFVAGLPFEYTPRIGPRATPTAAIDVVFDIQKEIFHLMYGSEPADELMEV